MWVLGSKTLLQPYRRNWWNSGRDMASFRFSKMAFTAILDFEILTVGTLKRVTLCQISSKLVKPPPKCGDFSIFQDGGRRHLGFSKFQIYNGRMAQEGWTASPCHIWSKSIEPLRRYDDFSIFFWNEKKKRTGQEKKSQKGYISPIWGEAPTQAICVKNCVVGDLLDVITFAKFQNEIFGVELSIFLLIFEWPLQQCSATVLPVKLECGPMPNMMATLSNIGGTLGWMSQSLADAHYSSTVQ